jgi:glycerol 2-dehydrogenase (NADP+)
LELHLYNPQHKLVEYLKSKGIVPQAYSPLGTAKSTLFTDNEVVEIAKQHGLQPADVLLGYLRKFSRQFYSDKWLILAFARQL